MVSTNCCAEKQKEQLGERETVMRLRAFSGHTITKAMLAGASPEAILMHCLPAHQGEEVEDAVIESPRGLFDQAESRLHVQKALLALLLSKDLPL